MKRLYTPIILISLLLAVSFCHTYDYDLNTPPDTGESPTRGSERIREIKCAIQERQNLDHYWPLTGDEVSDVNAGIHRRVTFYNEGYSEPNVHVSPHTILAELQFTDANGHTVQLTDQGTINLTSSDLIGTLANDTWFTAVNSDGANTVNLIKATAYDTPEIGADANLPFGTTIDPNDPNQRIVNKKYVDEHVGAANYDPTSMTGATDSIGEITFPNGFIMKWGSKAVSGSSSTAVVFEDEDLTDFPNACFQVITCGGKSAGNTELGVNAANISTTGFTAYYYHDGGARISPFRWFAIGY